MKFTLLLTISALVFGLAQTAFADHHDDKHGHDGYQHSWQDADANKDGVISKDEFMKKHQERAEKMFSKLDENKDGKVDQAERDAMRKKCAHHNS